jgi:hypothetical protein
MVTRQVSQPACDKFGFGASGEVETNDTSYQETDGEYNKAIEHWKGIILLLISNNSCRGTGWGGTASLVL